MSLKQQCLKHQDDITRIYLNKEQQSVQLICEECSEDKEYKNKSDSQVILQRVFKLPEELLSKINLDISVKQSLLKLSSATEDDLKFTKRTWNERFDFLKKEIDELKVKSEQYFDQLIKQLNEFRGELVNIVNFNQFRQFIINEQYLNKETLIENYIKELETDITGQKKQDILNQIQIYKDKVKNTQIPIIEEKLQKITKEMNEYQETVIKYLGKCNPDMPNTLQMPKVPQIPNNPIMLPKSYFSKILSTIQLNKLLERLGKQRNYTLQQVYQASKQVLNCESFWDSINNKSNLLMVFRSFNNTIFGGYTPCQWKKQTLNQLGIYDQTYSSFIFSLNNDDFKIFPIKKENKSAIILYSLSGPNFGNDLIINADFQGGQLKLGNTYQNEFQLPGQQQYLFSAQSQPNISECEIIEIIYQ